MGLVACRIRADRHQHDNARSGPAVFHPPVVADRQSGWLLFFRALSWQPPGHVADQFAPAAFWIFKNNQRWVFLLCDGLCFIGIWAVVSHGNVCSGLRHWLWTRQPFHQYSRHEFALYQCGRRGEPAEFFLGHRRGDGAISGRLFFGALELPSAYDFAGAFLSGPVHAALSPERQHSCVR